MENITVEIDNKDLKKAQKILEKLGLDLNTYINMTIKQLIIKNSIPFKITNNK